MLNLLQQLNVPDSSLLASSFSRLASGDFSQSVARDRSIESFTAVCAVAPISADTQGQDRFEAGLNSGITGRRAHAAVRMHAVPTTGFWGYCTKPMADHSQPLGLRT